MSASIGGEFLVRALRETAGRLEITSDYQWGHFGSCNCGHLAQTLTRRTHADIHRAAVERATTWGRTPVDDWGDAAIAYCPASGLPLDDIVTEMLEAGVTLQELRHLEDLSDRRVLRRLPLERRHLRRNDKSHVALYLRTWADLVEEELDVLPLAAE